MSLQETCKIMSIAIQNGDLETVRNLIEEQGFPVDQRMHNSGGETPFSKAASSGHVPIAEYLLNKGAYIDNRNNKTNTPLMITAFHGHEKMVVLLLLRGADPFATGADNYTADTWARAKNNTHISNLIINFTKHGVAALNTDDVAETQTDIWNKTSNDEIEHIYYRQNGQLRMTDIFNFADKERTRHTQDLSTHALSTITRNFSHIEGKQGIRNAFQELCKQGGQPSPHAIRHTRRIPRR